MDHNRVHVENWKCLGNSIYDRRTKTWTGFKRVQVDLADKSKLLK